MINKNISDEFFRNIKLLSSADIKKLITMEGAINAMEQAFASCSEGTSRVPQRYVSEIEGMGWICFLNRPITKP